MPRLGYSGGRPFLFAREAAIGVDPVTIGKGIDAAGGGIDGAIAILLVVLGIGIAFVIWKAYQKKIEEDKKDDEKRIDKLETEVSELRKESREREGRLIELVANGQKVQAQTNNILTEIKTEQTEMRSQLAYLQGSVNQLKRE